MDSRNFVSAIESPLRGGASRKVFGEITNMNNTPIKEEIKEESEALTPLANLKMLTRVASDIPPPKRELFREDSMEDHDYHSGLTNTLSGLNMMHQENLNFTPSPSSSSSLGPPKVSRKQKSLGLLCEKFMSRFPESVPEGEKCEIPLDDLAKQMATERRRIYDIVNVLEAVQMMTKVGKNLYQWHGIAHRIPTLAWLKQLALKLKMLERFNEVKLLEESSENFYQNDSMNFVSPCGTPVSGISPFSPSLSPTSCSPSPIERKTSLGVACQKFLMLFLIAPEKNAKINLDFAARVIHGVTLPDAVMKTRIRRLYDIANILQSLQLIQKVQVTESTGVKKPAFQYIGPDVGDEVCKNAIGSLPSSRQRNSLLAVGKNLLNIPDEEEDLEPPLIRSTNSADLVKPLKKRFVFGESDSKKRPASTSLLDLSNACEVERAKIRCRGSSGILSPIHGNSNMIRISPIRRSHIISPNSQNQRKPLSPLTHFNRKLVQIGANNRTVIHLMPASNGIAIDLSKSKH